MSAAPILNRQTFETSRLLEFFTEKELRQQIGHGPERWPIALLKELIDNSLDACESAGIPPEIGIKIQDDELVVTDNGPGIPRATVERSLDYLVRVSDKAYYVSPTRGQLGNALKCVYAAPYVLSGEESRVEVEAQGLRHMITVRLDRLAQEPRVDHQVDQAEAVRTGTLVRVRWPGIAGLMLREDPDSYKSGIETAIDLIHGYAAFNPHARFQLRQPGDVAVLEPTRPGWHKWLPSDPTSPHWYGREQLRDLIAAYVTSANGTAGRTVREFVSEFRGLSGTAKQKFILAGTGLGRAGLADLVADGDLDMWKVTNLLAHMKAESRPVKPEGLGVVGEDHLVEHLTNHRDVEPESIRYRKVTGESPRPHVWEVAFGIYTEEAREEDPGRDLVVGLNWSPAIQPPIRELLQQLGQQRVDRHDPVIVVVHLATPVLPFTDRGKSVLDLAGAR
jgi:DNA topoisomerase VI subunit B